MDKRQRVSMQRALVREALGKLHAATEFFGTEDGAVAGGDGMGEFEVWQAKLEEFEAWVFGESPIA